MKLKPKTVVVRTILSRLYDFPMPGVVSKPDGEEAEQPARAYGATPGRQWLYDLGTENRRHTVAASVTRQQRDARSVSLHQLVDP
ncbi:hypothetical protein U1Q18_048443 [Sarracenia purpurea var. burkii]